MDLTIAYFAFLNLVTAERVGLFRTRKNGEMYAESYDPETGMWVDDHAALAPYLYNGEPGYEPITESDALSLMGMLKAP